MEDDSSISTGGMLAAGAAGVAATAAASLYLHHRCRQANAEGERSGFSPDDHFQPTTQNEDIELKAEESYISATVVANPTLATQSTDLEAAESFDPDTTSPHVDTENLRFSTQQIISKLNEFKRYFSDAEVPSPENVKLSVERDMKGQHFRKMRTNVSDMFMGVRQKQHSKIQEILNSINAGEIIRLTRKENAAEFCKRLGLNPLVADTKYRALARLEEELGIEIKIQVLESIYYLIDTFGGDNPFTEPPKGESLTTEKIVEVDDYNSSLGAVLKEGKVHEVISAVESILEKNQLHDKYMHGTSAQNLQNIITQERVDVSTKGRHDFGVGVYCFKGQLNAALSFAVDRSWPKPEEIKGGEVLADNKYNPAVVLFLDEEYDIKIDPNAFHVGFDDIPFSEEKILKVLKTKERRERYSEHQAASWKKSRDDGTVQELPDFIEDDKNFQKWAKFVSIARVLNFAPVNSISVMYGWLHECYTTENTDAGEIPEVDKDGWVQYCFQNIDFDLGKERLFIEFHFSWREWGNGISDIEGKQERADESESRKLQLGEKCDDYTSSLL